MRNLRRRAAVAAAVAVSAFMWPGATAPAAAHDINCYLPGDLTQFGGWVSCQQQSHIHSAEHEVTTAAWIAYCYYEYLNGRPCF